jgi:acetylornithine/succinyldiaminopimelate/putrescine aminotransferase
MHNSIHGITIKECRKDIVVDWDNNEYIDFTSGIFAASLGLNNDRVASYIIDELDVGMHSYQFGTIIQDEYLEKLCEFTGYESVYMFSSGTEATEAAWKIARLYTGKSGIWGLTGAFHGKTFGAQIMAGREPDWRNQTPADKTGALIFEPYNAPTARLHDPAIIEKILTFKEEHSLILIADEVQAGFYRTGKLFGYMHYPNLEPDLVCIGKGMTNGFPASAVLGSSELIENPLMELSSTNGGNPLACAAGLAVIEQMDNPLFVDGVQSLSDQLMVELSKLSKPVHCIGMVAAIVFDSTEEADEVVLALKDDGLLVVHTKTNTVKIGPPLNMATQNLKRGLGIIRGVVG